VIIIRLLFVLFVLFVLFASSLCFGEEELVAQNEFYKLYCSSLQNGDESFKVELFESDAQLAIGIMIDVSGRAVNKGFRFFEVYDNGEDGSFKNKYFHESPENEPSVLNAVEIWDMFKMGKDDPN
jgi:hypothetical protein